MNIYAIVVKLKETGMITVLMVYEGSARDALAQIRRSAKIDQFEIIDVREIRTEATPNFNSLTHKDYGGSITMDTAGPFTNED